MENTSYFNNSTLHSFCCFKRLLFTILPLNDYDQAMRQAFVSMKYRYYLSRLFSYERKRWRVFDLIKLLCAAYRNNRVTLSATLISVRFYRRILIVKSYLCNS